MPRIKQLPRLLRRPIGVAVCVLEELPAYMIPWVDHLWWQVEDYLQRAVLEFDKDMLDCAFRGASPYVVTVVGRPVFWIIIRKNDGVSPLF